MQDEKIQFIIDNLQEGLDVEVKNWLNGLQDKADKAKLAKEIIALGNNGGGLVFIGFDDEGVDHPEIDPADGEFETFTQDAIAAIVDRYVMPPCQCRVEFYTRTGGSQSHPVVIVPGEHRTPLWAQRGSEGNELENGKVYVRRPGGKSEVARNQDDWEKLIERLVKARQSEMLGAIREIIEPSSSVIIEDEPSLEGWTDESYAEWLDLVSKFETDDPRRLEKGHWIASFSISSFSSPPLAALNETLDRQMPKYSGWPPFTYLHRDPIRPEAHGDIIKAYIGHMQEHEAPADRVEHCDFWRLSRSGQGFLLRPMQEDREGYAGNIFPRPTGPFFDWVIPIYRVIEVLKFIEKLGQEFGSEDSSFQLMLRYHGTQGRRLQQNSFKYNLFEEGECKIQCIESSIEKNISEIGLNIEEIVYAILSPVYEQFDFTKLPRALVNNVVKDVVTK